MTASFTTHRISAERWIVLNAYGNIVGYRSTQREAVELGRKAA